MKSTKFKRKTEKGITLIALIITIVVLLILAVVAINSIQNDGIISHVGNTANTYNQAVQNEATQLQNYLDYLDNLNGGSAETKITPPTQIEVTAVNTNTITLYAIGGTVENGTVAGYQYSIDGTTWSETIVSGTAYTTPELTEGTNWTVYTRTIDENGNQSTSFEYKIISFETYGGVFYSEAENTWGELADSSLGKVQGIVRYEELDTVIIGGSGAPSVNNYDFENLSDVVIERTALFLHLMCNDNG